MTDLTKLKFPIRIEGSYFIPISGIITPDENNKTVGIGFENDIEISGYDTALGGKVLRLHISKLKGKPISSQQWNEIKHKYLLPENSKPALVLWYGNKIKVKGATTDDIMQLAKITEVKASQTASNIAKNTEGQSTEAKADEAKAPETPEKKSGITTKNVIIGLVAVGALIGILKLAKVF